MQCPNLTHKLVQLLCTVFIPPLSKDHTAGQASKKSERVPVLNFEALHKPLLEVFLHTVVSGLNSPGLNEVEQRTVCTWLLHLTRWNPKIAPLKQTQRAPPLNHFTTETSGKSFRVVFPQLMVQVPRADLMQLLKTISVSLRALFH